MKTSNLTARDLTIAELWAGFVAQYYETYNEFPTITMKEFEEMVESFLDKLR